MHPVNGAARPLISVITPTRNRAWALDRALESVRHQRYGRFEHLVIDDGSSDDTWRVLAAARADPRLHVFHTENAAGAGAAAARNLGLAMARGQIVCYLDDDNTYLPTALEAFADLPDDRTWGVCFRNITYLLLEAASDAAPVRRIRRCSAQEPDAFRRPHLLDLATRVDTNCLVHRRAVLEQCSSGGWPVEAAWGASVDSVVTARLARSAYAGFWLLPQVFVEYEARVGGAGDSMWGRAGQAGYTRFLDAYLQEFAALLTPAGRAALEQQRDQAERDAATPGYDFGRAWFAGLEGGGDEDLRRTGA